MLARSRVMVKTGRRIRQQKIVDDMIAGTCDASDAQRETPRTGHASDPHTTPPDPRTMTPMRPRVLTLLALAAEFAPFIATVSPPPGRRRPPPAAHPRHHPGPWLTSCLQGVHGR
jgi:hypothetical protein